MGSCQAEPELKPEVGGPLHLFPLLPSDSVSGTRGPPAGAQAGVLKVGGWVEERGAIEPSWDRKGAVVRGREGRAGGMGESWGCRELWAPGHRGSGSGKS